MEKEDIRLKKEEKVFFDNFSDCYLKIDEVLLSELILRSPRYSEERSLKRCRS